MVVNKKFMLILFLLILVAVAVVVYFIYLKGKNARNEMRFTGKITNADFGGVVGGSFDITVDGIQVKLAGGKGENGEWGKIIGIDLSQQERLYVGKTVKVYAVKYINKVNANNTFSGEMEDGRLTLEGNKNYFVEIGQ